MSNEKAISELEKVLGYIENDELNKQDKDQIVEDAVENYNAYVNPGWFKYRKSVSTNAAFVEWTDNDSYFYDVYGTEFIDCLGGFGIYMCGHRNPEIIKVVKAQLEHQALHSQELLDPLRGYLAKVLSEITPGDLKYCFFTNGGAEAVEMALKLARIATGGKWYISAVGGFHGKTIGALSIVGKATYRLPYLPLIQQVQHVEFGRAEEIRSALKNLTAVGETVAAVILEPIQGEAGVIIPPKGYLQEVREICDEYKVCLIFDEIQTGMGRTGTMWRCEAEGVTPDILTYGKAFGGGVLPITGIIARPHLWTEELQENPWILGSPTFGGNPLCCAAALATINFMLKNDIPGQAKAKGDYLIEKLKAVMIKFPDVITHIRGAGLMIAVEFNESDTGYLVAKGMFARHVMTAGTLNNSKTIRFEPAATISYKDLDTVVERFQEAVDDASKEIFNH
jgi:putrescine aminotransferase